MSLLKKGARLLGRATNVALRGTAEALSAGHRFVAKHEGSIARAANTTAAGLGKTVEVTGRLVSKGAQEANVYLREKTAKSDNAVVRTASHIGRLAAGATHLAGQGTAKIGELATRAAPAVGGAVGGVARGAVEAVSGAVDSVAISEAELDRMRRALRAYGLQSRDRYETKRSAVLAAHEGRRRAELLDLLVVGGITLSQALRSPGAVPADVVQAFELAYPGLAANGDFADAISGKSTEELLGFANAVKGKLFELNLVDHMNDGNLPDGLHAELARSATQPGWDIHVLDSHGDVVDLLQAKATESVSYVKEALERYPDIDVTTTSEVYAQLVALGMADNVHDGGIAEAALDAKVAAATDGVVDGFDASDLVPSSLGLAVIALSAFMDKSLSLQQRGADFGSRSARAGMASGAGKLAMVATQTWWLALVAGVGSSWLANKGRGKREHYEALSKALADIRHLQLAAARKRLALPVRPQPN